MYSFYNKVINDLKTRQIFLPSVYDKIIKEEDFKFFNDIDESSLLTLFDVIERMPSCVGKNTKYKFIKFSDCPEIDIVSIEEHFSCFNKFQIIHIEIDEDDCIVGEIEV